MQISKQSTEETLQPTSFNLDLEIDDELIQAYELMHSRYLSRQEQQTEAIHTTVQDDSLVGNWNFSFLDAAAEQEVLHHMTSAPTEGQEEEPDLLSWSFPLWSSNESLLTSNNTSHSPLDLSPTPSSPIPPSSHVDSTPYVQAQFFTKKDQGNNYVVSEQIPLIDVTRTIVHDSKTQDIDPDLYSCRTKYQQQAPCDQPQYHHVYQQVPQVESVRSYMVPSQLVSDAPIAVAPNQQQQRSFSTNQRVNKRQSPSSSCTSRHEITITTGANQQAFTFINEDPNRAKRKRSAEKQDRVLIPYENPNRKRTRVGKQQDQYCNTFVLW